MIFLPLKKIIKKNKIVEAKEKYIALKLEHDNRVRQDEQKKLQEQEAEFSRIIEKVEDKNEANYLFKKIDILRKQEGTNQIFYCSDSCPIDDEDFTYDDIPAIWGFYWD